jgi:hypothetical protein
MKAFQKVIFSCIFLVGIPMLWWLIGHSASQTYLFWKHGIEKQAMVVALDHTSSISKGGTAFHYVLKIDDHAVIKGFLNQLPIGYNIPVLSLSDSPSEDDIITGAKSDGLFNIFSAVVGGKMMAVIYAFLIPCLVITTWLLPNVVKRTWEAK